MNDKNRQKKEIMKRLRGGKITIRELTTFNTKLKTFSTKYAAQVRGICLKTRRGLEFANPAAALKAGQECMRTILMGKEEK